LPWGYTSASSAPAGTHRPQRPVVTQSASAESPDTGSPCTKFSRARIYVGVITGMNHQAIFSHRAGGNGDEPELCEIAYGNIGDAEGLALDQNDHLWEVSWLVPAPTTSLLVFDKHANGDASPIQVISGSNTLLSNQAGGYYQALAIDAMGNAWVPNGAGNGGYITEYANNANGNVSPIGTIGVGDLGKSEGLSAPNALAFDSHGDLFVSNQTLPGTIAAFAPPFADNSKPIAQWTLPEPLQYSYSSYLAFDRRGNLYVAGQQNLDMYPKGLQSGGVPSIILQNTPALIFGLATDAADQVYVANEAEHYEIDVLPPQPLSYSPVRVITSSSWNGQPPKTLVIGP
jgi:hypothetical protein